MKSLLSILFFCSIFSGFHCKPKVSPFLPNPARQGFLQNLQNGTWEADAEIMKKLGPIARPTLGSGTRHAVLDNFARGFHWGIISFFNFVNGPGHTRQFHIDDLTITQNGQAKIRFTYADTLTILREDRELNAAEYQLLSRFAHEEVNESDVIAIQNLHLKKILGTENQQKFGFCLAQIFGFSLVLSQIPDLRIPGEAKASIVSIFGPLLEAHMTDMLFISGNNQEIESIFRAYVEGDVQMFISTIIISVISGLHQADSLSVQPVSGPAI